MGVVLLPKIAERPLAPYLSHRAACPKVTAQAVLELPLELAMQPPAEASLRLPAVVEQARLSPGLGLPTLVGSFLEVPPYFSMKTEAHIASLVMQRAVERLAYRR